MALLDDPIAPGGPRCITGLIPSSTDSGKTSPAASTPIRSAPLANRVGHRTRRCVLDPVAVVHWFVLQVLHGNTSLEHVARLGRGLFTGAAYCLARSALPLAVFQIVLVDLIKSLIPATHAEGLWRGHRTFLVDGSAFSMPDTPELQARFGQPGGQAPGCGFPVAKILALFHAGTGVLLKVMVTPLHAHEMASVEAIHPALSRAMSWSATGASARMLIWRSWSGAGFTRFFASTSG